MYRFRYFSFDGPEVYQWDGEGPVYAKVKDTYGIIVIEDTLRSRPSVVVGEFPNNDLEFRNDGGEIHAHSNADPSIDISCKMGAKIAGGLDSDGNPILIVSRTGD